MKFLKEILKGLFIGTGAILPGISSGVLCVVMGIYEDMIYRILNFFKNIKGNILFFTPIAIGSLISVVFISKFLLFFFNNYTIQTSYCFMGLILGCTPSIINYSIHSDYSCYKKHIFINYLVLIFTFSISIYLLALEHTNIIVLKDSFTFFEYIINGFLMSIGIVVPGVSNTIILMLLGNYNIYLSALSSFDLTVLIPMGIGVFIGCIIFLKIISFMFKNYKTLTYFSIIGFTTGSIFILFPGFSFTIETLTAIIIMIFSFILSYKLSNIHP